MLKINLDSALSRRGVTRPFAFLRGLGISHNTAHRLLNKTQAINLRHLERLCRHLNCTPNDLMEFTDGEQVPLSEDHALQKLVRGAAKGNITHQLRSLPPEALDKVWNLIDELKGGAGKE